jgi:hypothetical protein
MTSPRLRRASLARDPIRAKRTLFLCGSHAPRRGRALVSRDAAPRRTSCECACIAASANRGRGLRARGEGLSAIKGIWRAEGENRSTPNLRRLDFDVPNPTRSRYRPRRISRAPATDRTGARAPDHRRSRLSRTLRFPRWFSARERGGASHGACPRSLRDVFGHTASISRRRTS